MKYRLISLPYFTLQLCCFFCRLNRFL
uniref:Uncharacterized protein n=1 Tax=Anguilla anguilla TaxID=7936 RepID=A0A0E9TFP4_ANGAN